MKPYSVVTLIAAAAVHFISLDEFTGLDSDPGPDAKEVLWGTAQLDLNPVVSGDGIIPKNGGFAPGIENDNIKVAIVVQVAEGGPATA